MKDPNPVFDRRWQLDGAAAAVGLVVAAAGIALAANGVSAIEEKVFRLINDLPDVLERTLWAGQLLGLLLLPVGLVAVAAFLRRWRLALALALLAPAKLFVGYQVIRAVSDRERPVTSICGGDLTCLHQRGTPAAGVSMPQG